jgi:nucleotide-binding universal stress UspA family protein
MSYKTILIHCNDMRRIEPLLAVAVTLAEKFKAHLLGLSVVPPMALVSVGPEAPPRVIDAHCELYRAETRAMKSAFEVATRGRSFTAEWREDEAGLFGVAKRVLQYAKAVDLVIVGQTDPEWPDSQRLDVADRLAIESSRPVLIVPNVGVHDRIGEKVLVACNARRQAKRAIFHALPILQGAVRVVWVNPQAERELEQHISVTDICVALARHLVKCQATEQVAPRAGVGETLLACARDFEADLLVIGCYGHMRPRQFVFGRVSRYVLAHMSVPILMSH